jgi:hypothetical protein
MVASFFRLCSYLLQEPYQEIVNKLLTMMQVIDLNTGTGILL